MIKLTNWMTGTPPAIGEYNVSNSGDPVLRRWWDGSAWSLAYSEYAKQKTKRLRRCHHGRPYGISWRGLRDGFMAVMPLATR